MRKGRDGGKKKREKKKKRQVKIVATTSLPAVDRPNADRWNAARSCQYFVHQLSKFNKDHTNPKYVKEDHKGLYKG